jgi:ubiquinone/menaquinone biosynthesis C-methylase UbiE
VLDVACGTGNLSIPAAKSGANVTGQDISPNLLEQAREWARREELNIHFDENDAEAMPYNDASFATVVDDFTDKILVFMGEWSSLRDCSTL